MNTERHFNRPPAPQTADRYDFSWLSDGYTVHVKHNVPYGTDQRESSYVQATIYSSKGPTDMRVWIKGANGQSISGPEQITDENLIQAFDELKTKFVKVLNASKYLGTYPKVGKVNCR